MMEYSIARASGKQICLACRKVSASSADRCVRCGSRLNQRKRNSVGRTLALLTTATLLYVPANYFPIMYTDQFGQEQPSTIIGGVILLIELGSIPIAVVIFLFSVILPITKILAMYFLVLQTQSAKYINVPKHARALHIVELVGKWSMVDVFVVALLVSLIQFEGLMAIRPGIAIAAFAGMVIATLLASDCFDSRLLWDRERDAQE